jgi:DNA modification methylase
MQIEQRPTESLIPYARNAKLHSDAQVAQIAGSIREFGFCNPVLVDADGGIIAGHGRVLAARKLGLAEVPCITLGHLTEIQRRAYIIADNRLAETGGGWDTKLLALELEDLRLEDYDLNLTGFDAAALDEMFGEGAGDGEGTEGLTDPDEVPEPLPEPVSKPGDVWILGRHRLMCGDSTKAEDVATLMAGERAELVVTDPPYGVSYADKNAYLNAVGRGNRIQVAIENDHGSKEQTQAMWKAAFHNMSEAMSPGAVVYCFMPQGGDQMMMMMMMMGAGIEPRHELVWLKNNHVLGRVDYAYKHEPILYAWKDGGHKFYGDFQTSILEFPKPHKSDLHPTMKPVPLIERLIQNSSKKDGLLYEPFSGSGTALIAAEQAGRRCFAMEISPQYVDVAVRRWEAFTGRKATRA